MQIIEAITEFVNTGPVVLVYLFMLAGAFTRGQCTFWLGRYMRKFIMTRGRPEGGWRLKLYTTIHSESTAHATDVLQRRGWPIIPLSFLTIGFQTLVQLSAGVIGMPWLRYTPAMLPGAMAWALIYTTIGWAVWAASISAITGSPWALIGVAIAAVVLVWWRKRNDVSFEDLVARLQGNNHDRAMEDFPARLPIKLGQLIKLANLADTGGQARELIENGLVSVNGEIETRRSHKLDAGDLVELGGFKVRLVPAS